MTNEQAEVKRWMTSFGQQCPGMPMIPSLEVRRLRAKLILEEALETIHAMNLHPYLRRKHYEDSMIEDDSLAFWEDPKGQPNLLEIADGCEDLKVVTEGTLVSCGLIANKTYPDYREKLDPLFDEVMRSNWSKMWTEDELEILKNNKHFGYTYKEFWSTKEAKRYIVMLDGKIIKSPSYSNPNLSPIIDSLK